MSAILKVLLVVATTLVVSQATLIGTGPECTSYTWSSDEPIIENITDCITFTGDVVITGSNFTNITFLAQVEAIGGALTITDNGWLDLVQLSNLTTVNGTFTLKNNVNLTSASVGQLTWIKTNFVAENLPKLTTLNLAKLVSIGGGYSVKNVASTVIQTAALTTVAGDFSVTTGPNAAAYTFPALLVSVGGNALIQSNKLTSVKTAVLKNITGKLSITGNDALTAIDIATVEVLGSLEVDAAALIAVPTVKAGLKTQVTTFKTPLIKCNKTAEFYAAVNSTKPATETCDSSTSIDCPAIATLVPNATFTGNVTHGAGPQTLTCNNGTEYKGVTSFTCQANGTWTELPKCNVCAAGTYHAGPETTACIACADNWVAPIQGMSFCLACPNNTWSGNATGHATHDMCYCKVLDKYYPVTDAVCTGKGSGASSVMGLPALVLAALAAITMMVTRA